MEEIEPDEIEHPKNEKKKKKKFFFKISFENWKVKSLVFFDRIFNNSSWQPWKECVSENNPRQLYYNGKNTPGVLRRPASLESNTVEITLR